MRTLAASATDDSVPYTTVYDRRNSKNFCRVLSPVQQVNTAQVPVIDSHVPTLVSYHWLYATLQDARCGSYSACGAMQDGRQARALLIWGLLLGDTLKPSSLIYPGHNPSQHSLPVRASALPYQAPKRITAKSSHAHSLSTRRSVRITSAMSVERYIHSIRKQGTPKTRNLVNCQVHI
jgi:hypothetical protein